MSTTQEATVNSDGSTTYTPGDEGVYNSTQNATDFNTTEDPGADDDGGAADAEEEFLEPVKTDPAFYLGIAILVVVVIYILVYLKQRRSRKNEDEFFSQLDGEKFNLKLPAAVEEYCTIKAKCLEAGWEPGQGGGTGQNPGAANGPQRVLAQALMKRCIADIPLVQHIQKEASGMNKLYSHSMCSVMQWRSYQAAEAMVSAEVEEVRAEADEIEPGWSQVIWRQAMQYHNMLKQKHEMEAKAMASKAEKQKAEQDKAMNEKKREDEKRAKELAAEKAAAELIKAEEREKDSKTAFNGGMKKGFLQKKK